MNPACLFVYGTLRRGCDNDHARRLAAAAGYLGGASIAGTLYRYDWHPGAAPAEKPEHRIHGDLFRLNDAPATLADLDSYEGPEFARVKVTALLDSGAAVEAWVYTYHGPKQGSVIESGEWFS